MVHNITALSDAPLKLIEREGEPCCLDHDVPCCSYFHQLARRWYVVNYDYYRFYLSDVSPLGAYGEAEFIFASIKVITITGLIVSVFFIVDFIII